MDKEKILVAKILNGDQKEIKHFLKKFEKPLLSFIKKRANSEEDAKDILQETFISTLRSLPEFEFRSPIFSWLCSIAKHETVDFYRKKKVKTVISAKIPFFEEIVDQALGPEGKQLKEELKEEVKNILFKLSEGYSKILRLKYVDRLSVKTIAQKLKVSVKAVESRLTRARNQFKEKWIKKESKNLAKEYSNSPP